MSEATSKEKFADYRCMWNFASRTCPTPAGQARSNSGVYSTIATSSKCSTPSAWKGDDECGGFYKLREPDVNMCFPPLTWQTYDVDFTAPKYARRQEGGQRPHHREAQRRGDPQHVELPHATPGREEEGPPPAVLPARARQQSGIPQRVGKREKLRDSNKTAWRHRRPWPHNGGRDAALRGFC